MVAISTNGTLNSRSKPVADRIANKVTNTPTSPMTGLDETQSMTSNEVEQLEVVTVATLNVQSTENITSSRKVSPNLNEEFLTDEANSQL